MCRLTTILRLFGLSTALVLFLGFYPHPAKGSSDQEVPGVETEIQERPCRGEVTDSVIECLTEESLCKDEPGKRSCRIAQTACKQARTVEESCLRQLSLDHI